MLSLCICNTSMDSVKNRSYLKYHNIANLISYLTFPFLNNHTFDNLIIPFFIAPSYCFSNFVISKAFSINFFA